MIDETRNSYKVSINTACKIYSISQSAYYYKQIIKPEDEVIKCILSELAEKHIRWGFDKMMSKIKLLGYKWNHKRVYRVYCEMGLNIRIKPKKRLPSRNKIALVQPIKSNVCWSIDFMSDVLSDGRRFRTLNIIDDYNSEALLIHPAMSLPSRYVTQLIDQVAETKGYPSIIRVDNGPEFISSVFKEWAKINKIFIQYIQPGKPAQNGFIERFNRTFREDILDMYIFESISEVSRISADWIILYNNVRPHESLGNKTPINFANSRAVF